MGWMEGLLGGFSDRKSEIETQNLEEARQANERESGIYKALLSSPDPEIQAMAATGLLDSAKPRTRKGGLRGWMGEMSANPTFSKLQELINTPVETPGQVEQLPHTNYPMIATPPPGLGEAPAGTPAKSLTEPGAPPAPHVPAAMEQVPGRVATPPTSSPRKIFASPEDLAIQGARGKAMGDVEGDIAGYVAAGMTRADATAQVRAERLRAGSAAHPQSIAGEIVGPDRTVKPAFGVFSNGQYHDPNTGLLLQGFRPRTTTGSTSMGADREAIARELFGMPFAQLNQTQQGTVNTTAIGRTRDIAFQRGMGTGQAKIATELATPVGPSAARLYNVSPTTTLEELRNVVGLSDEQKSRVYAASQLDVMIDDIDALLPDVFPNVPEGWKGSIKSALSLGIQKFTGDADLAALDAAINGALAQVAQMTGQPGSRLSDKDLLLAKGLLANLTPSLFGGDTLNTARARVGVIKQLLEKAKGSIPSTPQVGAKPPIVVQPPAAQPQARTATPPPTPATSSGPAGWFVVDGKLVNRAAAAP